jgi:hypothetical protein
MAALATDLGVRRTVMTSRANKTITAGSGLLLLGLAWWLFGFEVHRTVGATYVARRVVRPDNARSCLGRQLRRA